MRIESGVHEVATHIKAVYLDGHKVDHVFWFDTSTYEICLGVTNAKGEIEREGDFWRTRTVRGVVTFNLDPEHMHLLPAAEGAMG